jgi:hypothetical protein
MGGPTIPDSITAKRLPSSSGPANGGFSGAAGAARRFRIASLPRDEPAISDSRVKHPRVRISVALSSEVCHRRDMDVAKV